jgi:hypothetical protein
MGGGSTVLPFTLFAYTDETPSGVPSSPPSGKKKGKDR